MADSCLLSGWFNASASRFRQERKNSFSLFFFLFCVGCFGVSCGELRWLKGRTLPTSWKKKKKERNMYIPKDGFIYKYCWKKLRVQILFVHFLENLHPYKKKVVLFFFSFFLQGTSLPVSEVEPCLWIWFISMLQVT